MPGLYELVRFASSTTGNGTTLAIGAAVTGFRTPATAAIPNGTVCSLSIQDGTNWEVCTATYNSGTPNFTNRTLVASSTGALLSLTGAQTIGIQDAAVDHLPDIPAGVLGAYLGRAVGSGLAAAGRPVWGGMGRQMMYDWSITPDKGSNTSAGTGGTAALWQRQAPIDGGPGFVLYAVGSGTAGACRAIHGPFGEGSDNASNNAIATSRLNSAGKVLMCGLRLPDGLSDGTNTYQVWWGIFNAALYAGTNRGFTWHSDFSDGIAFSYNPPLHGSNALFVQSKGAGTAGTAVTTGVTLAADTLVQTAIHYRTASAVDIYVNGTLTNTLTTNLPSASAVCGAGAILWKTAGAGGRRASFSNCVILTEQ